MSRIALLAVSLLSLGIGGYVVSKTQLSKPTKSIFVLIALDISGSTSHDDIRRRYLARLEQAMVVLGDGSRFVVILITDNAAARDLLVLDEQFPAYSAFSANPLFHKKRVANLRDKLLAKLKEQLFTPRADATDLMGTLSFAEKIFSGSVRRAYGDLRLVIMSDGFHQTPELDLASEQLDEHRIGRIIESEKARGGLPRLTHIKVWMVGAGMVADDAVPMSRAKLEQLQLFWVRYFSACGARLTPDRYGPTFLNFSIDGHSSH